MSRIPRNTHKNLESNNLETMDSLSGIRKLKQDKVDLYQQTPKNTQQRHQPQFSSFENHSAPIGDHVPDSTVESWFHHGIQKKLQRNIRMGKIPIDALLDLHGYKKKEAVRELNLFLSHAIKTRARLILIVHGKGYRSQKEAILRPLVQHWLSEQHTVLAYCPAQIKDGGNGATYVYLKSSV